MIKVAEILLKSPAQERVPGGVTLKWLSDYTVRLVAFLAL